MTAETGFGKTTRIPQIICDGWLSNSGPGRGFKIVVTLPLKAAMKGAANFVASERRTEGRNDVGYVVRHNSNVMESSVIVYTTEGFNVNLRVFNNPTMRGVGVIMIDEVHQRTVDTNVLLGVSKLALACRPDLRAVVTSATMPDQEKFKTHLVGVILPSIPGCIHPVEVVYKGGPPEYDVIYVVQAKLDVHSKGILAFVTGVDECDLVKRLLQSTVASERLPSIEVYTLNSSTPEEGRDGALNDDPRVGRKIVVATNAAEASLTVEHIGSVVDLGFAKPQKNSTPTGQEHKCEPSIYSLRVPIYCLWHRKTLLPPLPQFGRQQHEGLFLIPRRTQPEAHCSN